MATALEAEERQPLLKSARSMVEKSRTDQAHVGGKQIANQDHFPYPSFTLSRKTGRGRLPQCIAHRGFKAINPENTLQAFRSAIEQGGAHAIETDIHLTSDNVVVLSHDPDLKRCFGRTERIIDCDWNFVSQLRTVKEPHVPMPRLSELLTYIAQPELQHIWILLDIKIDNDADDVMRLIAETLASVNPGDRPWSSRVVLGIWAAKYLSLCVKYLPTYPVAYIGFSTCYARQFLSVPNVGFNMFAKTLFGPIGSRFIRDVQRQNRPLYLWTVNDPIIMKWAIAKGADGVITDDPKLFNEVSEAYNGSTVRIPLLQWLHMFWLYILIALFSLRIKRRFPGSAKQFLQAEKSKVESQS